MPAYIIVEVEIHDPEMYESYKKLTPDSLLPFGGKFIVRGGQKETLEGDWSPERLVVLEFPDMQKAKDWWSSEKYSAAKAIRYKAAKSKMILLEGFGD
jgi:uncharacterized protein (DUF1330 family)